LTPVPVSHHIYALGVLTPFVPLRSSFLGFGLLGFATDSFLGGLSILWVSFSGGECTGGCALVCFPDRVFASPGLTVPGFGVPRKALSLFADDGVRLSLRGGPRLDWD